MKRYLSIYGFWAAALFWLGGCCTDSCDKGISILASPDPVILGQPVALSVVGCDCDPKGYRWDFNGDGIADAQGSKIKHTFSLAGTANVKVWHTEDKERIASRTLEVVDNCPFAAFVIEGYEGQAMAMVRKGEKIKLLNRSNKAASYRWEFDGYRPVSTVKDLEISFNDLATFSITLSIVPQAGTQTVGCEPRTKTELTISVVEGDIPRVIASPLQDKYAPGTQLTLKAENDGAEKFRWIDDQGKTLGQEAEIAIVTGTKIKQYTCFLEYDKGIRREVAFRVEPEMSCKSSGISAPAFEALLLEAATDLRNARLLNHREQYLHADCQIIWNAKESMSWNAFKVMHLRANPSGFSVQALQTHPETGCILSVTLVPKNNQPQ